MDFQPALHLNFVFVKEDFHLHSRSCLLMFSKGSYLVLTEVDLSHPGLSSVSVRKQQCLQVCYTKIINILPLRSQSCVLAPESGPMYRINIPDNLDDPCEYSTIGQISH